MNLFEKLLGIQVELKAPKNQFNNFGKYNYRSCEDVLEGLKPLLEKFKAALTVSDEIEQIGDRYYIRATAKLWDTEKPMEFISATAYAREDEAKKGMDLAQVTGSTSSYARKYALNGLFAIDDTKDSDSTNTHDKGPNKATTDSNKQVTGKLSDKQIARLYAISSSAGVTAEQVKSKIKSQLNKEVSEMTKDEYDTVCKYYEGLKK